MRHDDDEEQPLTGGNVSAGVVRVGDTVRRPAGPWTPAVHALLAHLHASGFRAAPRPLGVDDQGREVLTYAPGSVVWPDRFRLLDSHRLLADVARLIRDFHDAAEGFTPPADAQWQVLIPPEPDADDDLIVHHDLAPWNLVMDGDGAPGTPGGPGGPGSPGAPGAAVIIDWDVAGPGSRLWDLAYAVHGFVPLSANPAWQRPEGDAGARLRLFADAYGLDEEERRRLAPLLARRTRSMHDFLREQTSRGTQPWATLWAEGHGAAWLADAEYTARREERWLHALLG